MLGSPRLGFLLAFIEFFGFFSGGRLLVASRPGFILIALESVSAGLALGLFIRLGCGPFFLFFLFPVLPRLVIIQRLGPAIYRFLLLFRR